jgi:2-methylcitrate dehydratase PrpD
VAAAALDYDSLHLQALVHSDAVLLPAMLAIAERQHIDGKRFISSLAAATDVMCRLAMSTREFSGWFYTSIHGVFAAAAGCAMLLDLKEEGIRDALGLALFQVGGTQQCVLEKGPAKRMLSAFAARAGLFSSMLAKAGVTSPREAFEGRYGFYAMYESGSPEIAAEGLGQKYLGTEVSIKKFPSCGCNHAVIEGTLQLVRENNLKPSDILEARATISSYMNRLVGAPYDPSNDPQVAAQFSVQYSVACALLNRRLGLAEIQPNAARDQLAVDLARKVQVVVDDDRAGQLAPAEIELVTKSHGVLRRRITILPGSPDEPLSDSDVRAKVQECMTQGENPLTESQVDELIGRVMHIEGVPDVASLFDKL